VTAADPDPSGDLALPDDVVSERGERGANAVAITLGLEAGVAVAGRSIGAGAARSRRTCGGARRAGKGDGNNRNGGQEETDGVPPGVRAGTT
jgi:hypothetical protein